MTRRNRGRYLRTGRFTHYDRKTGKLVTPGGMPQNAGDTAGILLHWGLAIFVVILIVYNMIGG